MAQKTGDGADKVEKDKKEEANIVSIELLEGATEKTDAEVIQYVNIQTDPANHVDGTDITHVDRLGQKLRLKVKFDKAGEYRFKVKLTPGGSNSAYTAAETGRNTNFEYSKDVINFVTDSNGEKIIEADKGFVSPAGDDVFEITATDDNGKEVKATAKIKTKRMMYYVEAKMAGLASVASSLSTFTGEYDKHYIKFKDLGSVNIAYMHNIGDETDSDTFKSNIQTAYASSTGPSKAPYCIAIGYTDHLAVKDTDQAVAPVSATGGSATPINVPIIKLGSTGGRRALWNNIVPGEDWFVECYFLKNGGNISTDKVVIPKNKCTPVQAVGYPADYCDSVNVNISSLPAETGKIFMKVNWVNRMRGGLSFPGTNIVAVCTKSWWANRTINKQIRTIVHEVGHQLKMVPFTGKTYYEADNTVVAGVVDKSNLDPPAFQYTGRGHRGSHCHAGLLVMNSYDSVSGSTCAMFGVANGITAFCSDCAKAVKKIDLKNGV